MSTKQLENMEHQKIPQPVLYAWLACLVVIVLGIINIVHENLFERAYFDLNVAASSDSMQGITFEQYQTTTWIDTFVSGAYLVLFAIFAFLMYQGKNVGRIVVTLVALLNIVSYIVGLGTLPLVFTYMPGAGIIRVISALCCVAILYFTRTEKAQAYFHEMKAKAAQSKAEKKLKKMKESQ